MVIGSDLSPPSPLSFLHLPPSRASEPCWQVFSLLLLRGARASEAVFARRRRRQRDEEEEGGGRKESGSLRFGSRSSRPSPPSTSAGGSLCLPLFARRKRGLMRPVLAGRLALAADDGDVPRGISFAPLWGLLLPTSLAHFFPGIQIGSVGYYAFDGRANFTRFPPLTKGPPELALNPFEPFNPTLIHHALAPFFSAIGQRGKPTEFRPPVADSAPKRGRGGAFSHSQCGLFVAASHSNPRPQPALRARPPSCWLGRRTRGKSARKERRGWWCEKGRVRG